LIGGSSWISWGIFCASESAIKTVRNPKIYKKIETYFPTPSHCMFYLTSGEIFQQFLLLPSNAICTCYRFFIPLLLSFLLLIIFYYYFFLFCDEKEAKNLIRNWYAAILYQIIVGGDWEWIGFWVVDLGDLEIGRIFYDLLKM
jgi:hypothetical protein